MTEGAGRPALSDLAREERRRQLTVLALGVGLFVSTIPVNNQRALFSPLGDIPILGELSPTAYAVTFGGIPGGGIPRSGIPGGPGGYRPPVAYAARVPGLPAGGIPGAGVPGAGFPGNVQPFAAPPGGGLSNLPPAGPVGAGNPGGSPGNGGGIGPGGPGGISPGGGGGGGGPGPNTPGGGGGTTPGGPGGGGVTPGGPGGGGLTPPGSVGAVPEPATWLTMILGFGVIGAVMRRARRRDLGRDPARKREPIGREALSEG
ncbi:PEP-CTERM protein-sorting domain-containing protein [Sphingomonas gellani]|uniref:PEP-CTERM protein-sorting domain-containing protein n=1 Tax=Sphingomonas gellani TaxID=1166340 RepID=A0A1H8HYR7_9SPHN|nr:PEPxxWA-CTERM sorting domain-containing protein [Sphingomonas gellani]SEN61252.1 PEP-CTERM protein-sorting domain-containing protein [Sphingomonas gellani]